MKIFVGGPVIRPGQPDSALQNVYLRIGQLLDNANTVFYPRYDEEINALDHREFVHAMVARIRAADRFIGILAEGYKSSAVETALASAYSKPILLLCTYDLAKAPRMLLGLPEVVEAGHVSKMEDMVTRFVKMEYDPFGLLYTAAFKKSYSGSGSQEPLSF